MAPDPRDPRRWFLLVIVVAAAFVVVLDNSVLTVAIPTILREFDTNLSSLQWVVSGYSLVFATLLIIGGRSMGGRAASMLAADGFACDGLLLLAYPLHPAGQTEKLRDAHLPAIRVPVLCFNGTRDALARRDLMEAALKTVKTNWKMHWLEGADHSFHVLKSSGRTDAEVLVEIANAAEAWAARLTGSVH